MASDDYRTLWHEIEILVAAHPAWQPKDIRRFSVKERKHWLALAFHDRDVREAARNG